MTLAIQLCVPIVVALLTLMTGYLLNNFPAIKGLPRKWGALVRSTIWLTLLSAVVMQGLVSKDSSPELKRRLILMGGMLVTALVYEACGIIWAIWKSRYGEENGVNEGDANRSAYLKKELIKDVRFRVQERLDYAMRQQDWQRSLMAVPMKPVPAEVGREARHEAEQGWLDLVRKQVLKVVRPDCTASFSVSDVSAAFNHEYVDRKLLILGEPGAGKTTALLTLASELLAQTEGTRQFPYIFELSAWKDDSQDLLPWLAEQLRFEYPSIDLKTAKDWITTPELLPLLDGLDELSMDAQRKCVVKINEFASLPGQQVVVCCRSQEYAQGAVKLRALKGALRLEPLNDAQIEQYLKRINRRDVWRAMQLQPELKALLAQSVDEQDTPKTPFLRLPLFLQMLVEVYRADRPITSEKALLDAYIERQLGMGGRTQARQSDRVGSAEWAYAKVEDEPSDAETKRYLSWLARKLQKDNNTNNFLIEKMQPSWLETNAQRWQYRLIFGLIVGLIGGLIFGLIVGLIVGLIGGLIVGLIVGLIKDQDIELIETFNFSFSREARKRFLKEMKDGLIFGLIVGLIVGLIGGLIFGLIFGLIGGLIFGLIVGLIVGLKEPFQTRKIPNQGIIASAKNLPIITIICYPAGVAMYHLPRLLSGREVTMQESLVVGIGFALVIGISFGGGLAVLQHSILRFLLYRQGNIPHNYAKFLKYTTERRLTQQIGGHFRFIHRELLDHFADMDTEPSKAP